MSTHFRTFTVVAEIDNNSDLRYVGSASMRVEEMLKSLGFVSVRVRNAPNESGEMPPWCSERGHA